MRGRLAVEPSKILYVKIFYRPLRSRRHAPSSENADEAAVILRSTLAIQTCVTAFAVQTCQKIFPLQDFMRQDFAFFLSGLPSGCVRAPLGPMTRRTRMRSVGMSTTIKAALSPIQ
jgi:hypothetical protein